MESRRRAVIIQSILRFRLSLTISILVKEAEGFLEFSNLFFSQLVSHGGNEISYRLDELLCFCAFRKIAFSLLSSAGPFRFAERARSFRTNDYP